MQMPGRKYSSSSSKYRYGFNGKENDNEVKGEGNQQDYGMRIYDPRLGRFLSQDPVTGEYPELTPYQFASNTPIRAIDLDGLEMIDVNMEVRRGIGTPNMSASAKNRLMGVYNEGQNKGATVGTAIVTVVAVDIFVTKGWLSRIIMGSQVLGAFEHNRANTPEGRAAQDERSKEALANAFIGWGAAKFVGGVFSAVRSGIPQGLTASEFKVASQRIYNEVKDISKDIVVQGSRAAGTAKASSDIDFAIRVNSKEFDQLIVKAFGSPKEGTAKWKTMQNAIKTGKIQSGEAGLRPLRKNLEKLLGKNVDISVVKKGGEFDNGIIIPVKNP